MSEWVRWWRHKVVWLFLALVLATMAICFITAYWQQNLIGLAMVIVELLIMGYPIRRYGMKVLELIAESFKREE